MKKIAAMATLLAVTLSGCTDAGSGKLIGPDDAKPGMSHVSYISVCCAAKVYEGVSYDVWADVYDNQGQPLYNQMVYWSTSGNGVASIAGVSNHAMVTAHAAGTTTIYANVGSHWASTTLTVLARPRVTTVQITPSPVNVQVGQTQQLTARAYDQYGNLMSGKTATWSIDNSSVATLGSGGSLHGAAVGTTTARATIDGVTGTASVSVTPALYVSISGPAMITSAGNYSWTATASGGDGSYTYQWEVDWVDTPHEGFIPVDTGNPFNMSVDGCDGSFEVRVVVVSGGSRTTAGGHFVENYAPSSCW